MEQLILRGQQGLGTDGPALLSAPEAERMIEQLAPLDIEEVGGHKWHAQHGWIERLNMQAHLNAQSHSDEFVVELLVSLDKIKVLVHDLLLIEAWRQYVLPHLLDHFADHVDSLTSYLPMFHEVAVTNLLEVSLFHGHAAEALPEEYLLELADWAYRKLALLNSQGQQLAEHKELSVEQLMRQSRREELQEKLRETEWQAAVASLSILRYITDYLPRLPMGALSRVVSTNDTVMALLPLLDKPPWSRSRTLPPGPDGKPGARVLERWSGNKWAVVPPADRFKMSLQDGQVWLALTNLLVEPRCRAKYDLDGWRKERLLGLKRHLNELLFDQLPVLKDLQRALDEMALGVSTAEQQSSRSGLILEAVPVVREAMLRGRDWKAVAARAKEEHFGEAAKRLLQDRISEMVKALDMLAEFEPEQQAAQDDQGSASSSAQPPSQVKVSTWRKVHDSGVYEPWYDFTMELDDSKPPEHTEVSTPQQASGGASSGGSSAALLKLAGLRYRLKPLDIDSTRPFPVNGKIVVRYGEYNAEMVLQLPELPTRDSEEGAGNLWVNVGLLPLDGIVLQIKLKKAPKPKERDRVAGVWYAYHPVAGALTVAAGADEGKQQQKAAGGGPAAGAKVQQPPAIIPLLGKPAAAAGAKTPPAAAAAAVAASSGSSKAAPAKSAPVATSSSSSSANGTSNSTHTEAASAKAAPSPSAATAAAAPSVPPAAAPAAAAGAVRHESGSAKAAGTSEAVPPSASLSTAAGAVDMPAVSAAVTTTTAEEGPGTTACGKGQGGGDDAIKSIEQQQQHHPRPDCAKPASSIAAVPAASGNSLLDEPE